MGVQLGGHLKESMSMIRVPVMTKSSFVRTEREIGELWSQELQKSMAFAGMEEKRSAEEKRLVEERGDYHDGVPAITVIVDGG